MIKRTPQEIADFFGCYVARDNDLRWHVFRDKPEKKLAYWRINNVKCGTYLNTEFIDTSLCDKRVCLYEPKKKDSIEVFKDIQSRKDIDAKPDPHASEVYVGPEYKMLCGDEAGDGGYIGDLVNGYLAKGWRLYGAPFYGNGFIWQAMVRGV